MSLNTYKFPFYGFPGYLQDVHFMVSDIYKLSTLWCPWISTEYPPYGVPEYLQVSILRCP